MRRATAPTFRKRPTVAIIVDGVTGFGRAVLRGVMRHANLQRKWLLHEELTHAASPVEAWPKFDGIIIAGVDQSVAAAAMAHCANTIQCSGSADPSQSPVVCLDDYAAGVMAAEHLLASRLKHFGFVGYTVRGAVSANRYAGFYNTVTGRGFGCHEPGLGWLTGSLRPFGTSRDHWPMLLQWVKQLPKPIGIMAVDDWAAHDLAALCVEANISVPDQVAIIGVNNDDLLCDSAWPPLSSIEADYSRAGYIAAGMMERLLAGQVLTPAERFVRLPPLGVVKRLSTELLAVEDPVLAEVVQFIREHACDPCNVADILERVPVGRRWLERRFAAQLGRTLHEEILRIRMETAKRLLQQPELSISEIATRCGSSAVQNFCRAFEQSVGATPAAYRRSVLRGD
ncbi:MAG: substrate-binding domain-containing protein [Tepidisphaeraceae bacterium]